MKWGLTKRNDKETGLSTFRNEIDRVFEDFFSLRPVSLFRDEWMPSVDVEENEKEIHVTAEIPGLDEKDLSVTLENGTLTISGEKNEEKKREDKKNNYILSERSYGSFCRRIHLPDGITADRVQASYKNGVLNISIPKDEQVKAKPVKISIN